MNISGIGNTYVYNTETKNLSKKDERGNECVECCNNNEKAFTNDVAPALTYSEYKELANTWRLGQASVQQSSEEKSSRELLQEKLEDMQDDIENGNLDHDPVVKIGASEFTEKEWDTFLENFDELQEEIREAMRIEYEKALKESQEEEEIQKELMEKQEEEERLQKEEAILEQVEEELLRSEYLSGTYVDENSDGKEWKDL